MRKLAVTICQNSMDAYLLITSNSNLIFSFPLISYFTYLIESNISFVISFSRNFVEFLMCIKKIEFVLYQFNIFFCTCKL